MADFYRLGRDSLCENMGDFYLLEEKNLEDIFADVGKCMDQVTAMRVECADMDLALATLNNPLLLKKLDDLAFECYGENTGEDEVTMVDIKQEDDESTSESDDAGVREEEMDNSNTNDNNCDSCSEVVVNNELTKD